MLLTTIIVLRLVLHLPCHPCDCLPHLPIKVCFCFGTVLFHHANEVLSAIETLHL
ncbi:MAG TPA: hypothetical protein VGD98_18490 [Ktedonobacteraceae bacterium]